MTQFLFSVFLIKGYLMEKANKSQKKQLEIEMLSSTRSVKLEPVID